MRAPTDYSSPYATFPSERNQPGPALERAALVGWKSFSLKQIFQTQEKVTNVTVVVGKKKSETGEMKEKGKAILISSIA